MKLYTRTGDKGVSSLLSGERVPKNDPRMKAYGDVDELNSVIGGVIASAPEETDILKAQLKEIQSDLFSVGAKLATTSNSKIANQLTPVDRESTEKLEGWIDDLDAGLKVLRSFVLPGGHPSAAWAHLARTVCRRAERSTLDLRDNLPNEIDKTELGPILVYMNRLSDYLFAVARECNRAAGIKDVTWSG